MTTTRRITFNINNFLKELQEDLIDRHDMIDDTVQKYKDFLGHSSEKIREDSKNYVNKHPLVLEDQVIKSFIDACHKLNFDN